MASTRDESMDRKTRLPSQVNWSEPKTYWHYLHKPGNRLHLNFVVPKDNPNAPDNARQLRKYIDAQIQGPQDEGIGGMFSGINKHGLVAAVNNLEINLDVRDKLARGGLVLDALTFQSASTAAHTLYHKLAEIQRGGIMRDASGFPYRYPAFNLIIADANAAYVVQSAPKEIFPKNEETTVIGGQIKTVPLSQFGKEFISKNGAATIIGDNVGHHRVVSIEKLPSKEPIIICGWGTNDQRHSLRTRELLTKFTALVEKDGKDGTREKELHSLVDWLEFMQDKTEGKGGAYNKSIAQPPSSIYNYEGKKITWGTISTSLFTIREGEDATPIARMYYSPTPPKVFPPETSAPMQFQKIRSVDSLGKPGNGPTNLELRPYVNDEGELAAEVDKIEQIGATRSTAMGPPSAEMSIIDETQSHNGSRKK